jgi:hypothetical protein
VTEKVTVEKALIGGVMASMHLDPTVELFSETLLEIPDDSPAQAYATAPDTTSFTIGI